MLCLTPALLATFVPVELGIDHVHAAPHDTCLVGGGAYCEPEHMSGGVAAGDIDGDGDLDLYFSRIHGAGVLYRNDAGRFIDVTTAAGLAEAKNTNGAVFADFDNDGDLDLYLTTIGSTRFHLFMNDGEASFRDEGLERGAAVDSEEERAGFGAAVGDFNRDGYLDLFVTEWFAIRNAETTIHTRLLRNRGAAMPAFFDDATVESGIAAAVPYALGLSFSPSFVDLDQDGWPDLAIVADFGMTSLFWNERDGTFRLHDGGFSDENGMGSTFGDVDGDGDLDWFVTSIFDSGPGCTECNWGRTGNRLYRNDGHRRFVDATDDWGVREGGWGWGAAFTDINLDARLDLVMTNGIDLPELVGEEAFHDDPMRAWCNQGDRFIECSDALALTDRGLGAGLLATDLDDDGDDDLIVVNTGGRPVVYENQTDGHWLQVIARGVESNRDGVGVIVSLRAREEGAAQVRVVGSGAHFLAHAPFVASFGLGSDLERVHELRVRWPQGTERIFRDVPVDQRLVVMEREDGAHVPRSDAWKPTDGCSSAGPLTGLWALTVLGLGKSLSRRRTRGR